MNMRKMQSISITTLFTQKIKQSCEASQFLQIKGEVKATEVVFT